MGAGAVQGHGRWPVAGHAAHALWHRRAVFLFLPVHVVLRHWQPVPVTADKHDSASGIACCYHQSIAMDAMLCGR